MPPALCPALLAEPWWPPTALPLPRLPLRAAATSLARRRRRLAMPPGCRSAGPVLQAAQSEHSLAPRHLSVYNKLSCSPELPHHTPGRYIFIFLKNTCRPHNQLPTQGAKPTKLAGQQRCRSSGCRHQPPSVLADPAVAGGRRGVQVIHDQHLHSRRVAGVLSTGPKGVVEQASKALRPSTSHPQALMHAWTRPAAQVVLARVPGMRPQQKGHAGAHRAGRRQELRTRSSTGLACPFKAPSAAGSLLACTL